MRRVWWIASYPKSGNTWLRVFLANLQRTAEGPVDINTLAAPLTHARAQCEAVLGYPLGELTPAELQRLRPHVYRHLAQQAQEPLYAKVHDAYSWVAPGTPLIPTQGTGGAWYVIRNPLDVCVSLAFHTASTVEATIAFMAETSSGLCQEPDRLWPQFPQSLRSWSQHVQSWVEGPDFPVHVMRYEDMYSAPLVTFAQAAAFAGLPTEPERLARALQQSTFTELQQQEQTKGFREKQPGQQHFFRAGRPGVWHQHLTAAHVARLVADHAVIMQRFGYLTASGETLTV